MKTMSLRASYASARRQGRLEVKVLISRNTGDVTSSIRVAFTYPELVAKLQGVGLAHKQNMASPNDLSRYRVFMSQRSSGFVVMNLAEDRLARAFRLIRPRLTVRE